VQVAEDDRQAGKSDGAEPQVLKHGQPTRDGIARGPDDRHRPLMVPDIRSPDRHGVIEGLIADGVLTAAVDDRLNRHPVRRYIDEVELSEALPGRKH